MIDTRENGKAEIVRFGSSTDHEAEPTAQTELKGLIQLTVRLLREVQSLTEVHTVNLEQGLDFYNEVSRFEIELIQRALLHTAGHQGRAASLLNLKATTLNSKIKHFKNQPKRVRKRLYPLVETSQLEDRPTPGSVALLDRHAWPSS